MVYIHKLHNVIDIKSLMSKYMYVVWTHLLFFGEDSRGANILC